MCIMPIFVDATKESESHFRQPRNDELPQEIMSQHTRSVPNCTVLYCTSYGAWKSKSLFSTIFSPDWCLWPVTERRRARRESFSLGCVAHFFLRLTFQAAGRWSGEDLAGLARLKMPSITWQELSPDRAQGVSDEFPVRLDRVSRATGRQGTPPSTDRTRYLKPTAFCSSLYVIVKRVSVSPRSSGEIPIAQGRSRGEKCWRELFSILSLPLSPERSGRKTHARTHTHTVHTHADVALVRGSLSLTHFHISPARFTAAGEPPRYTYTTYSPST